MVDNEDRGSTASTVSELYRNIVKSPAPICMFYFAHPFGIASPQSKPVNKSNDSQMKLSLSASSSGTISRDANQKHMLERSSYTPWPEETWRRDINILPPLVQVLASQMGHDVPDLDTLIENIRIAWNSPTCRSVLQSVPWRSTLESRHKELPNMGSDSYCNVFGPGLRRRRYSLPEIIMRKHSLSQQNLSEETKRRNDQLNGSSFDNVKPTHQLHPHRPPRHSTGTQFEPQWNPSITPIDRSPDTRRSPLRQVDTSMRRQLLRRIWSKEFYQMDTRSGSWSPPLRRSQRRLNVEPSVVEKCTECSKLDMDYSTSDLITVDTSEANPMTAASELQTPSETITIKTSSSEQLTSKSDHGGDFKNMSQCTTPDLVSNIPIAAETFDNNHNSINAFSDARFIESNLTTDDPHSSSESDDRCDSSHPISSNGTAQFQPNSCSIQTDSHDTTNSFKEHVAVDNKQYQTISNVDQYIANLLIDSLNNVLVTTETQIECNSLQLEDNHLSSGQSDVNIISQLPDKSHCHELVGNQLNTHIRTAASQVFGRNQEEASKRIIYFPRYSSNNKDSLSLCSSMLTDDEQELGYCVTAARQAVIPVQSGSNYPSEEFVVSAVPRIVQRTESMEAQRASTSPYNCDSDTSLVDSLDDPNSPRPDDPKQTPVDQPYEKSQTFFVPIEEFSQQNTNEPINMTSVMPEKLREKMKNRLLEMDKRKTSLNSTKIKKLNKRTDKSIKKNGVLSETSDQCCLMKFAVKRPNKLKDKILQSEVGLLETYTIDRQGNMKFQPATKTKKVNQIRTQASTSSSSVSSRRQVVKKPVQFRRNEGLQLKSLQKKKKQFNNTYRRKEVQQLTLYQSDLMTPDTECGPRRMYQKTEIHDGKKRIEILEIVECIESSSNSNEEPFQEEDQITSFQTERKLRRSKIPVPVFKTSGKSSSKKTSQIFIKNQSKQEGGAGNTKVDQMIANLLIEALNHPEELSIGIVNSQTEFLRTLTPNTSNRTSKRLSEITSGANSRRLSSGPTKYHQVFDVIPEEKSSISVDSSTEEGVFKDQETSDSMRTIPATSSINNGLVDEASMVASGSGDSAESPTGHKARGKEGVDSESETAWMGFLKQHNDGNLEEGNLHSNVLTGNTNTNCILPSPINISTLEPSIANTVSVIEQTPRHLSKVSTAQSTSAEQSVYITSSTSSCMQCRMIDMDLNLNTLHYSTATIINTPSDYSYAQKMSQDEWQISNIKSLQACDDSINSVLSVTEIDPGTEIDTTSFIVVRDNPDKNPSTSTAYNSRKDLPPITLCSPFINIPHYQNAGDMNEPVSSQQRCNDCCFCNPDLHKRSRSISSACNYCNRLNDKWKPASSRASSQNETVFNKSTNTKPQKFFETQSKTDHTHIRTRSKDSDTVSLKCTKINTKFQRILPEDELNGNVFEAAEKGKGVQMEERCKRSKTLSKPPKVPVISPTKVTSFPTEPKLNTAEISTNTARSAHRSVRLPSPFINNANSNATHSYDSASSTSSSQCSSSLSSSPVSPSKKKSATPIARWPNHKSAGAISSRESTLPAIASNNIRKSRYQHFYGQSRTSEVETNPMDVKDTIEIGKTIQTSVNQQSSGWSLTLAGTYRDDMAPDLEMRLSFPKRSPPVLDEPTNRIYNNDKIENNNLTNRLNNSVDNLRFVTNRPAASEEHETQLPVYESNAKKTLSKGNIASKNINRSNCNLPQVNNFNRETPCDVLRKTIKRSQYSLAVASATTNTISKFGNGKRAMSYQTLNANSLCINNRGRNNHREHSIDLGSLSSRRLSVDSPATVSDGMALSVLGNAIAPEQKPRVPTMSERDLTRKPHSCFTRNRTIFS